MKLSKAISALLVFVLLFDLFSASAFAAEEKPTVDPNTGFTDASVLEEREYTTEEKKYEAIPATITEPVERETVTGRMTGGKRIHEESFLTDSYLKGTSAKMEVAFHVGEWRVNEVELALVYSASQFIDETKSSFTVLLNGVRCVTEKQPSTYGERSQIKLTLPASELKLGTNTLSIEADILTMGTAPETVGSVESGWFNVFRDSTIALAYEPLNQVTNIKQFYKKFISMESLDFKHSAVATPLNPTNAELENAMFALSGTSKNCTNFFQNLSFAAADNLPQLKDYENIIYVAEYARLPAGIKNLLSDWQKEKAEKSAVLALVKQGQQNLLVVTGTNEQALQNAAKLLANQPLMEQMNYTGRVVSESQSYEIAPKPFKQYRILTETGTQLNGGGVQSANYYIEFPYNRSITDQSQLYLVFRYADNLNFDSSMVTIYLNETPVASKKLNRNSAARDEVTFYIPNDIAVSGNFVLRVAFDLQTTGTAAPWAFVSPESTLKINWASQPFLVFDNYPSPFIKDGTFNDLMVVLPEEPSETDFQVMAQTFCLFGQYLESHAGDLVFVRDAEIFDINNQNVITIGPFASNQYTQSLNPHLFFRFQNDGTSILSNEKMLIDQTYGADLGTIQLLESPAAKDRAVLVMSGTSEKGLLKAASYLKTPDYAWKVFGDGFVADLQKIYNFKFKEDNAKTLSIPSKLRMRADLTSLLLVLSLLGAMLILSFIFLLVKYRKGVASREK